MVTHRICKESVSMRVLCKHRHKSCCTKELVPASSVLVWWDPSLMEISIVQRKSLDTVIDVQERAFAMLVMLA